MWRDKQTERTIVTYLIHELKSVSVQRIGFVAVPCFVPPVFVKVYCSVEIVGMEVVTAPVLETEAVASFGDIVASTDFWERTGMEMPFADPGCPVAVPAENVAESDFVVPGFDEVYEMTGRLGCRPVSSMERYL